MHSQINTRICTASYLDRTLLVLNKCCCFRLSAASCTRQPQPHTRTPFEITTGRARKETEDEQSCICADIGTPNTNHAPLWPETPRPSPPPLPPPAPSRVAALRDPPRFAAHQQQSAGLLPMGTGEHTLLSRWRCCSNLRSRLASAVICANNNNNNNNNNSRQID